MPKAVEPEKVREMLRLLEEGWTKKAIAEKLGVHVNTVRKYTRGLRRGRLGVADRVEELERRVENVAVDLFWVMEKVVALEEMAEVRRDSCAFYDRGRGLCTVVFKRELDPDSPFGEKIYAKDGGVYRPRVGDYPGFCISCPYHKPQVEKT